MASRWKGVRLPRASGKSPDFPGSFSATSPEALPLWNLTAIQGFPGSSPDFPGSSPDFPGSFRDFPGGQPLSLGSLTPSPDSQKLSLTNPVLLFLDVFVSLVFVLLGISLLFWAVFCLFFKVLGVRKVREILDVFEGFLGILKKKKPGAQKKKNHGKEGQGIAPLPPVAPNRVDLFPLAPLNRSVFKTQTQLNRKR